MVIKAIGPKQIPQNNEVVLETEEEKAAREAEENKKPLSPLESKYMSNIDWAREQKRVIVYVLLIEF